MSQSEKLKPWELATNCHHIMQNTEGNVPPRTSVNLRNKTKNSPSKVLLKTTLDLPPHAMEHLTLEKNAEGNPHDSQQIDYHQVQNQSERDPFAIDTGPWLLNTGRTVVKNEPQMELTVDPIHNHPMNDPLVMDQGSALRTKSQAVPLARDAEGNELSNDPACVKWNSVKDDPETISGPAKYGEESPGPILKTPGNFENHSKHHSLDRPFGLEAHFKFHRNSDFSSQCICNVCGYGTDNKLHFSHHMRAHQNKPLPDGQIKVASRFSCDVCGYKVSSRRRFEAHMAVHTGEKPFKCNFCDYRANQKSHLNAHSSTHVKNDIFHSKSEVDADVLDEVMIDHVRPDENDEPMDPLVSERGEECNAILQYTCDICGYRTDNNFNFLKHKRNHGNKTSKKSICLTDSPNPNAGHSPRCDTKETAGNNDCDNTSEQLKSLYKPSDPAFKESDTGEAGGKLFSCVKCTYTTNKKQALKKHSTTHFSSRITCLLCNKTYANKSSATKHVKTYHDKRHECRLCDFKTKYKWHLGFHQSTHSENKPYVCSLCAYKTTSTVYLRRHFRVSHFGKAPAYTKIIQNKLNKYRGSF